MTYKTRKDFSKKVVFEKPETIDRFGRYFLLEREITLDDYSNYFENYGSRSVIHFVYFDGKEVIDKEVETPYSRKDYKIWIKSKKEEAKREYITINDKKLYFDPSKTRENILLLVYMGVPLLKSLEPKIYKIYDNQKDPSRRKNIRKIVYQRKNVDLEKVKESLKWRRNYDRTMENLGDMGKPLIFYTQTDRHYEEIRPCRRLEDLLI